MNSNLVSQRNSGGEEIYNDNFEFNKKSSMIEKKSSMIEKKSSVFGSKRVSLESSINSKGRKKISAQSSRLSTKGKTPVPNEKRHLNDIGEAYQDEQEEEEE
jgi:hypothetical protein